MKQKLTIFKISDFIDQVIISPFFLKEFSSAEYVSKLRKKWGERYTKEIYKALDKLYKTPKRKRPKLLRNF